MDKGWIEVRIYDDLFAVKVRTEAESSLMEDGHARVEIGGLPGMKHLLAIHNNSDWWTRPHFDTDLAKLPPSHMLLWQIEDGTYGCIVALVHGGCRSQINGRTGKLGIDQILYDSGHGISGFFCFCRRIRR